MWDVVRTVIGQRDSIALRELASEATSEQTRIFLLLLADILDEQSITGEALRTGTPGSESQPKKEETRMPKKLRNSTKAAKRPVARAASQPPGPAPGKQPGSGDPQLQRAFDVVVGGFSSEKLEAWSLGRTQQSREEAALGEQERTGLIRRLHTAHKMAQETQQEIEHRIRELRRYRQAAAA